MKTFNELKINKSIIVLLNIIIIDLLIIYLISDKTFNLHKEYYFSELFYELFENLKDLKVNSDPYILQSEAFFINNQAITYYLPFPSLIRGVLSLVGYGKSPIVSVLLALNLFQITTAIFCFKYLGNILNKKFIIIFTITSCPALILMSYPLTYWESIIWAITLFQLIVVTTFYITKSNVIEYKWLIFLSALTGLTLFTRPTIVLSSILMYLYTYYFIISKYYPINAKKIFIGIFIFCFFLCLLFALNFFRWGNPFELAPLQYYSLMWSNEQLITYQKFGAFRIDRIPTALMYYFFPSLENFTLTFPFIQPNNNDFLINLSHFDYREKSLPLTIPLFFWLYQIFNNLRKLKGISCIEINKNLIVIFLISCIPSALILCYYGLAIRYSAEFFIPLILVYIWSAKNTNQSVIKSAYKELLLIFLSFLLIICTVIAQLNTNKSWAYGFPPPRPELSEQITFSQNAKGTKYLVNIGRFDLFGSGWEHPENWGAWSIGEYGEISIPTPKQRPHTLILNTNLLTSPEKLNIEFYINGAKIIPTLTQSNKAGEYVFKLKIPPASDLGERSLLYIDFKVSHKPSSPKSLGISNDTRPLGIGIKSIKLL